MVVLGTELKFNVNINPIDGLHMSDYDFECAFYVHQNKRAILRKSEMKYVDDDNYLAMITTEHVKVIGKGRIYVEVTAYIPDGDFPDNKRTEKVVICTDVVVS